MFMKSLSSRRTSVRPLDTDAADFQTLNGEAVERNEYMLGTRLTLASPQATPLAARKPSHIRSSS